MIVRSIDSSHTQHSLLLISKTIPTDLRLGVEGGRGAALVVEAPHPQKAALGHVVQVLLLCVV